MLCTPTLIKMFMIETSFADAKLIAEIPSRWKMSPAYFHSFGITKSGKLIFVEYPLCLNLLGLAAGQFMRKSYCEWMTWYQKEKVKLVALNIHFSGPDALLPFTYLILYFEILFLIGLPF